MNGFIQMVEQIELIRSLIDKDNSNSYRIALILIDNAFEVLMFRQFKQEYQYSDIYRHLLKTAKQFKMPDNDIAELKDKVIDNKRRKKIDRVFDEKLDYLCETKHLFSKEVKVAISYLHYYRNLTYHEEVVKRDTIKSAVYIYYKLLCDFFGNSKPSSYSSEEIALYKSFYGKYKLSWPYVFNDDNLGVIKNTLKAGYALDGEYLHKNIKDHIKNRIDEIKEALQFIKNNSYDTNDKRKNLDDIFRDLYTWCNKNMANGNKNRRLSDRVGIDDLDGLLIKFQEVKGCDEVKIFNMFSLIEPKIESVEDVVFKCASELDAAIQLEIDCMRGK